MSSLREAMIRTDQVELAMSRALIETPSDDDDYDKGRREAAEIERQAREDAATADATEIVMRVRTRVGRTKWSATEGRVIRQIVEALRGLVGDEQ